MCVGKALVIIIIIIIEALSFHLVFHFGKFGFENSAHAATISLFLKGFMGMHVIFMLLLQV